MIGATVLNIARQIMSPGALLRFWIAEDSMLPRSQTLAHLEKVM